MQDKELNPNPNVVQFPKERIVGRKYFDEHTHELIKCLGNTLVDKGIIAWWDYGETDEKDEWYTYVDHFGNCRVIFNAVDKPDHAIICRNRMSTVSEAPVESYILDIFAGGWANVAKDIDNDHLGSLLEFGPQPKGKKGKGK